MLRLNLTGSAGKFTFTPAGAAAPTHTQTISVNGKCAAAPSGTPMLASLTSVGGTLGLVTHGLGVRQKSTCGPAEGRFSGNEKVTVALGSFFGSDVLVADAELDIEGKFNASLDVLLDGAPVDRTVARVIRQRAGFRRRRQRPRAALDEQIRAWNRSAR